MKKEIKYRDWRFEVDFDRTKEVYGQIQFGCPESCPCGNCKNFAANREKIYPNEFKNLIRVFAFL